VPLKTGKGTKRRPIAQSYEESLSINGNWYKRGKESMILRLDHVLKLSVSIRSKDLTTSSVTKNEIRKGKKHHSIQLRHLADVLENSQLALSLHEDNTVA
jgi:hypothetical protein